MHRLSTIVASTRHPALTLSLAKDEDESEDSKVDRRVQIATERARSNAVPGGEHESASYNICECEDECKV